MKKTSCTILISVINELVFLKKSIELIRRYKNEFIDQDIIISDQTDQDMSNIIHELYSKCDDITILKLHRVDVGWSIDQSCKVAKGEYFCTLDGDTFPISEKWLSIPIQLLEKYNLSFVGVDTGLHQMYKDLGDFTCINNYFRVSKTDLVRKISEDVGFVKINNWSKVGYQPKINLINNQRNVDSAVLAQLYSNEIDKGDKLSFKINRILGMTNTQGVFGMIIDDLLFHMVLFRKMDDDEHSKLDKLSNFGENYLKWYNIINNGITDDVISSIIDESIPHNDSRKLNSKALYNDSDICNYIEKIKK